MTGDGEAVAASGIEISAEAETTAEELAEAVRAVTRDLPLEVEPTGFLAVLERLAEEPAS